MRLISAAIFVLLAVGFLHTSLQAQRPTTNSIAATTVELSTSAQLRLPRNPALRADQGSPIADLHYSRPSRRQGEILMIVGGAVILTGLLADEGLITIAGAAIGGYGLYVYLSASPKRRR